MGQMHHPTVLVVEDEGIVRMDAAETLRDAGFKVLEAVDACEALELVETRDDIEVVFTDVNMPGPLDGLELAHRIGCTHPDIHVIVTSGAVRVTQQDIPANGAFLRKPYTPEAVAQAVRLMIA